MADFFASSSMGCGGDDDTDVDDPVDGFIYDALFVSVKSSIEQLMASEDSSKEIKLPTSLSQDHMGFVHEMLAKFAPGVQVTKKWLPSVLIIVITKKQQMQSSFQTVQTGTLRRVFPIRLRLPAQISAMALKLAQVRWKRTSPYQHRFSVGSAGGDQVHSSSSSNGNSNFSIMTYLNTNPVVPSKAAKLLFQQDNSTAFTTESDAWASLLQSVGSTGQLHILWGLSKADKLNLAILLNNEAYSARRPCRIIYLQSLSILTFWMAFTVKGLCEDYHWDCSGYQITLENKTSPRNSIMFFELATFISALNRDINTSLVTHLIVDIDISGHQQQKHLFSLFLLYLKENFASQLRHMRLLIFATDAGHALSLQEYYADQESMIKVNLIDFQAAVFGNGDTRKQTVQISSLYLDDMANFRSTAALVKQQLEKGKKNSDEPNEEMERLMDAIHSGKIDIKFMLDFISAFPVLINYQCRSMSGITPLILTVLHGRLEEVARVLAIGADARLSSWEHCDGSGLEPMEWAINRRREDVFQLLYAHCYATSEAFDLHLQKYYADRFAAISRWPLVEVMVTKRGSSSPSSSFSLSGLAVARPSSHFKGAQQQHSHSQPQSYQVNYQLVLHLLGGMIRQIKDSTPAGAPLGAILILLPSYSSISTLRKLLIGELSTTAEHQFTVFCLYPHLPNNELEIALGFLATEQRSQVRIILSTLTLDSLLLVDIRYVLNAGVLLKKVQSVHCAPSGCYRLLGNGTSLATGVKGGQRTNIECAQYDALFDHSSPKVYFYNLFWKGDLCQKQPQSIIGENGCAQEESSSATDEGDCIYQCIFALESLNLRGNQQSIRSLFLKMVRHPPLAIVDRTVHYLKELNILNEEEHFTDLGRILINLSIEPQYAKMIIYSVLLRCLDPILTIVCALSSPQCFELTEGSFEQRRREMKQLKKLSHGSFSDHLTLVYAFQKWQEQTRANPETVERSHSAEENSTCLPILFSSFELIYSLRTKILGQLRACGFVKGKGPLNIRSLNANSNNFSLVKAAIAAGSSLSQLAQVKEASNFAGGGTLLVTSDGADFTEGGAHQSVTSTFLHPNSVLAYYLNKMSCNRVVKKINHCGTETSISGSFAHLSDNLILYDRKVRCGNAAYIEHCTLVSPMTVAIFANEAKPGTVQMVPGGSGGGCANESYMLFNTGGTELCVTGPDAARCFDLRARWQQFASKRLANINGTINEEEGNLIADILNLVGLADESIGFGPSNQHASIGKAPQVMSTYFCSTKMVVPVASAASVTTTASSLAFSTINSF